jgi:hypothetical protein
MSEVGEAINIWAWVSDWMSEVRIVDLVVGSESRESRVESRVEEVCYCACKLGARYIWEVD